MSGAGAGAVSTLSRSLVARLSPRHRAWQRLLESLTLDVDELPRPLPEPSERDFLICGSPRSGTALLTAALFQPPAVVTVMEPWDSLRLPPQELFSSLRQEITAGTLRRGRLDVDALRSRGAVAWTRDGEKPVAIDAGEETLLGVKFPTFWRYLDVLPHTKFLVCVRDPGEVIRSFEMTGGRLREGYDYDVPFNRRMNDALGSATADARVRRVLLYDYVYRHVLPHLSNQNVHVVRYERWFDDRDGQLLDIGRFLGCDVSRSMAQIRPPAATQPEGAERSLLAKHCTVSADLGYS